LEQLEVVLVDVDEAAAGRIVVADNRPASPIPRERAR